MNIKIIKKHNNPCYVAPKGDSIMELIRVSNDTEYRIFAYNPKKNTADEIGEGLKIPTAVEMCNAIWESSDIYYAVLNEIAENTKIDVHMYSTKTKTDEIIYSFQMRDDLDIYKTRVKIFILSKTMLIVQLEFTEEEKREDLMGHISFVQILVDIENETETEIEDENIVNNGINVILPISPTHILIKTGYSFIEDYRYEVQKEEEALIESIFINSSSKFIADLTIQAKTIDMQQLASTYYDKFILSPEFKDNYVFFTIIEPATSTSEIIFLNVETNEKYSCRNEQIDLNDLNLGCIIGGTPYVKNTASTDMKFLNLKNGDFDLSCMGEEFEGIIGDLLILKRLKKNRKEITEIYSYPKMELIYEAKGTMLIGCVKDDDYYLYF